MFVGCLMCVIIGPSLYVFVLGDSEGQGSLACCSPWGRRFGHDLVTEQLLLHLLCPQHPYGFLFIALSFLFHILLPHLLFSKFSSSQDP